MANDIVMVVWAAFGAAFAVAGGAIIWRRFSDYWKARLWLRRVMKEINSDLDAEARMNRLWTGGNLRVDTLPDLSDDEPTLPANGNTSKVIHRPKVD